MPHPVFSGSGGLDDVITGSDTDRLESWLRTHAHLEARRYPELNHWMSDEQFDDAAAFLRSAPELDGD